MKRKDECLFCNSRKCYERVFSSKDNGKAYDEIACLEHVQKLYTHSDMSAPQIMKYFASSTGKQKRGESK